MKALKSSLFYLGMGFLLTHEMDAMSNHEWRVLPVFRSLDDATGELAFLLAHVPLFAFLVAFVASLHTRIRNRARNLVSAFLVVHAVLHFAFSGHAAYEFAAFRSELLIVGAAIAGLGYFAVGYLDSSINKQRVV